MIVINIIVAVVKLDTVYKNIPLVIKGLKESLAFTYMYKQKSG